MKAKRPGRRQLTSKVQRNDPCPCGSGVKYKRCCASDLKVYLYDHPSMTDLWDTSAVDEEHARRSFLAEWKRREAAGLLPATAASFAFGKVYLDPAQKKGSSPT